MPRITDSDCEHYEYVVYDDWNPGEGHIQHHAYCCHHAEGDGYCSVKNCPLKMGSYNDPDYRFVGKEDTWNPERKSDAR